MMNQVFNSTVKQIKKTFNKHEFYVIMQYGMLYIMLIWIRYYANIFFKPSNTLAIYLIPYENQANISCLFNVKVLL